jgi:hypothetical protein
MEIDEVYIEAYLRGRLNAAAQLQADARYASDPGFKQAVEEMRLQMQLARLSHATHIAAQVGAARQRREATERPRSKRRVYYLSAAAAAVLLLVVGAYWWRQATTLQTLYADAFAPPSYLASTAGASGVTPEAYLRYERKDYEGAIPLLTAIPKGTAAGDSAQFYWAACKMEMGEFAPAIAALEGLEGRYPVSTTFGQDIRWYLALALMHEGHEVEAVRYLEVLQVQPRASHRRAVHDLLERLE